MRSGLDNPQFDLDELLLLAEDARDGAPREYTQSGRCTQDAREGAAQRSQTGFAPQVNMLPGFHYSQAGPTGLGSIMRQ